MTPGSFPMPTSSATSSPCTTPRARTGRARRGASVQPRHLLPLGGAKAGGGGGDAGARPLYPKPIATKLLPFTTFYPAEAYHRDYFARHPEAPYCRFVIAPKLEKARKAFKSLLRP